MNKYSSKRLLWRFVERQTHWIAVTLGDREHKDAVHHVIVVVDFFALAS